MGGLGDVAPHQHAAPSGRLDVAGGLPGVHVLLLVEIADQDVGALPGIGDGHRPADAAVASGDHGRPTGEPAAATVAALAVVGPRGHLGLGAGGLDLLLA